MDRLYAAFAELAVWAGACPFELVEMARGRSNRARLAARLGQPPRLAPPAGGRRIVVHAVSVGEMNAAGALAFGWSRRHPADRILLTAGNGDGLDAGVRLANALPAIDAVAPLPCDRPRVLRRWIEAVAPDLVVVVETELWPGLFAACAANGVPLALASARVYPRDVARYRKLRRYFSRLLTIPAWIGVQSAAEKERFVAIGAEASKVEIAGDLKLGAVALPSPVPLPSPAAGDLWCAGVSTHDGEEELLLSAFAAARGSSPEGAGLRLVLAPRHPRRAEAIATEARRRSHRARLLAVGSGSDDWDVLVVDRMGCLPELLASCAIAVIGGTFVRLGGQSPIEAARAGCAIVVGPHIDQIAERVRAWAAIGALRQLGSGEALAGELVRLLADPDLRRRMGCAAEIAAREADPVDGYCARLAALLSPESGAGESPAVGAGAAQASSQRLA